MIFMKKEMVILCFIFILFFVNALEDSHNLDLEEWSKNISIDDISEEYKLFEGGLKSQIDNIIGESVKTPLPSSLGVYADILGIKKDEDIYLEDFLIYIFLIFIVIITCILMVTFIPFTEKKIIQIIIGLSIALIGIRGGGVLFMYNYIMGGFETTLQQFSRKKFVTLVGIIVSILIILKIILPKIFKRIKKIKFKDFLTSLKQTIKTNKEITAIRNKQLQEMIEIGM